jgi:hypothetical protein
MTDDVQAAILAVPKTAWTPAYDSDRMVRPWATGITAAVSRLQALEPG